MKLKVYLSVMVLFVFLAVDAQDFKSPVSYTDPPKYKAGEVLVKFKDGIAFQPVRVNNKFKSGMGTVDRVFDRYQISGVEKLFPAAEPERLKTNRFPDGREKPVPQLYNIFLIKFSTRDDSRSVADAISVSEEVEWAEPNGEAYISESIPTSDPMDSPVFLSGRTDDPKLKGRVVPKDPLFNKQWAISAINADFLWAHTTGDTTQIISILDTGVDWTHPDLKNKIWVNRLEIPGNGKDDDGNGYIDDIRGWDFVNQDNNPNDDNSHGTHCAGIAAAETDNNIGIAGVSWGAKIMPIKVFQSNGIGYFSHIAQGFWYAARNGSTIFSNSWSSSGESLTIRTAMEYAYSKGLIIAAAGNMGYKTDLPFPPWPPYEPNFPACYNWVLGVEATDQSGNNTWFTNFDPSGPIISDGRPYGSIYYNDYDYNYEMRAPGLSLMSTVPNGQYREYSGTSMACPLVAGAIARMKSQLPDLSNEEVFAKLIQTIKVNKLQAGVLDILKCTFTNPPPDLYFVKYTISDSLTGDDRDGRADASEKINLALKVKNAGGMAGNVKALLRFAEFEDRSTCTFVDSTSNLGSISAYGTQTSLDPIQIELSPNLVHFRIISLQLLIWSETNPTDTVKQGITLLVEHGVEIKGTYSKLHLSPGAFYIVSDIAVIDTLTIDPGVTLTFNPTMFIAVNSVLRAVGTPDSLIRFTAVTEGYNWTGIIQKAETKSRFEYCEFTYAGYRNSILSNADTITNCIFNFCTGNITSYGSNRLFTKNVITNHVTFCDGWAIIAGDNDKAEYNIFAENVGLNGYLHAVVYGGLSGDTLQSLRNNVFINNVSDHIWFGRNGFSMKYLQPNYFGTTNLKEIKDHIQDFYDFPDEPAIILNGILDRPPKECHGVVWKVEINDQNPQDVPTTISNGPAKFSVYFNRPMDTTYVPFLTFGVRFPYTQNCVNDSALWSPDHKVWTAYKTIGINSGDGENTVRVGYAKDLEHFEIPIERSRFKFVIQAASSQSVDFFATPGIGKVTLEWPLLDSTNILGYNLYRYKMLTVDHPGDTVLVNRILLTDSTFVDYDVEADSTYYYMFTAVETDFNESDFSKMVSATPFNAANGDANGDLSVNVLDITTIVSWLLNQDPKPFLPDAADVNYDGSINVLDIIGVVQIIRQGKSAFNINVSTEANKANIWVEGQSVYLASNGNLAGVQFDIELSEGTMVNLESMAEGFEYSGIQQGNRLTGVLFSLSGISLPEGTIELFRIGQVDSNNNPGISFLWKDVFGGDQKGGYVFINPGKPEIPSEIISSLKVFPNPASGLCQIEFTVESESVVTVSVFDQAGKLVRLLENCNRMAGTQTIRWNGSDDFGVYLPAGAYTCRMVQSPVDKSRKDWKEQVKIVLVR